MVVWRVFKHDVPVPGDRGVVVKDELAEDQLSLDARAKNRLTDLQNRRIKMPEVNVEDRNRELEIMAKRSRRLQEAGVKVKDLF